MLHPYETEEQTAKERRREKKIQFLFEEAVCNSTLQSEKNFRQNDCFEKEVENITQHTFSNL
jgi:hypothetical protein